MIIDDLWTLLIAGYAAVVSTGALFLEVRRWFESGPRIRLSLMPVAKTINGIDDEATYIGISVTNFGDLPTTITHLILHQYSSVWSQFRNKPNFAAVIPNPSPFGIQGDNPPHTLQPGALWHGQIKYTVDLKSRARSGRLLVGLICTHQVNPVFRKVKLPVPDGLGD